MQLLFSKVFPQGATHIFLIPLWDPEEEESTGKERRKKTRGEERRRERENKGGQEDERKGEIKEVRGDEDENWWKRGRGSQSSVNSDTVMMTGWRELPRPLDPHHTAPGAHPVRLQAAGRIVAAVSDEVLAVVPQQAVGHGAHQPFRPAGHLLPGQRVSVHCLVHGIGQDPGSVREILHRVHPDGGPLGEHPEHQARVCHHLLCPPAVGGQQRQDVRDEVRHPVVSQVDAEVGEESPRDFQQVPPLEPERGFGGRRRRLIPVREAAERRRQQDGQLQVGEKEELLQEEGEGVQHDGAGGG